MRRLLEVSERRVCRVLSQPRMTQRYAAKRPDDEERLVGDMRRLAEKHPATATVVSGRFYDARDGRSTGSVSIACGRRAEFDGPKD